MPTRFWGPEQLDAAAWADFAARLRVDAEVDALVAALDGADHVLDVGGGTGLLTRSLTGPNGRGFVIEPEERNVMALRAVLSSRVRVVQARAEALPFGAAAFDAVVSTWVLQYTQDPWVVVREMARVSRRSPRSRVLLVQAAPGNELVQMYNACADCMGEPRSHHGFLLAGAAATLERAGFDVELRECPVQMDFRDVPLAERAGAIASMSRRLHHRDFDQRALQEALVRAARRLGGFRSGLLCDDGVLLVARYSGQS